MQRQSRAVENLGFHTHVRGQGDGSPCPSVNQGRSVAMGTMSRASWIVLRLGNLNFDVTKATFGHKEYVIRTIVKNIYEHWPERVEETNTHPRRSTVATLCSSRSPKMTTISRQGNEWINRRWETEFLHINLNQKQGFSEGNACVITSSLSNVFGSLFCPHST